MAFPAHVEALRLEMVERVWKESTVVGPLPELMCDIMAYIPKPVLTLEEISLPGGPDFIFVRGGIIYGIFKQERLIFLTQMCPPGKHTDLVKSTRSQRWYYNATYFYDSGASHLYILHDDAGTSSTDSKIRGTVSLLVYDVEASKVHKVLKLPNLSGAGEFPCKMAAVGTSVFLGVQWSRDSGESSRASEVLHVNSEGNVAVLWYVYDREVKLVGLHPVSASPLLLDVIYCEGHTCHSVRLEMIHSTAPVVFEEKNRYRISMNGSSGVFGGGILMVRSASEISLLDSRLRSIFNELSFPGNPQIIAVQTDRYGGIYFLLERRVNSMDRYRVLCAHPYFN
ncbi:hypothetical protein FOZ63_015782 [Perkinsus olseni]|uniref:Uncharacterized protein n=1 Tax=Perkinsus olseni TaxID=32597 RepID=A0A7J6R1S6_PEROL|nr:hypothetical protein FOZ60_010827 [Perkinsus olseni]KAF4714513.1 hypothetical protein FOZ63_015782 [Perkinsus olseni]KAF4746744.1 hypothetical protein FOZ62_017691 [Perkinsus olseni]